jgi:uncharacterized phage protein (TIGR01671 family)
MRTIKFRAWSGSEFIKDRYNHNHFISIANGKLVQVQHDDVCAEGFVYGNPEPVVLQQFTGLTDINGIEIYEGDIVNLFGSTCCIRWEDSDASFMAVERYESWAESGQEWSSNCTVIGNTCQNPELLK